MRKWELLEVGSGNAEVGKRKSEVGPVAVPEGRDYAAASLRKWESRKGYRLTPET